MSKINIDFYLNDENETPITSFHNLTSNPFKVNDIVHLYVDDLVPSDYGNFTSEHKIKFTNINNELRSKFKLKNVKLIKEGKYVRFDALNESKLTIEYHCEFVEDEK